MIDDTTIPVKIWTPDGVKKANSISSDEDHFGEKVYRNEITEEEYYKILYNLYKKKYARSIENINQYKTGEENCVIQKSSAYLVACQQACTEYEDMLSVEEQYLKTIYPLVGTPKEFKEENYD